MEANTVGTKVAVLNRETGRYVLATVTSVYTGPKQARVSIDGTEDTALLLWEDLHPASVVDAPWNLG